MARVVHFLSKEYDWEATQLFLDLLVLVVLVVDLLVTDKKLKQLGTKSTQVKMQM
eukprot:CAMPEP_0117033922 /NCGR_PEP_ID=MMETSP0472-20121206/24201_1 /TAXON_ID=693140 ORGANISM="Tiarina fusus, Strain LIS" /NCGR_SAMPLE_ID=MMETSP0472 /ASSEMBLY_ACC=CAM_ASM_000603 /LENGTH=54 /DNA_ID=CAMNT_0004742973 /DNA_START=146 /DNA_END=310 /DNA_ORIENTATION=+